MSDSRFDYLVETIFHFQNINGSDDECITDSSLQVFQFKDFISVETDLKDYCNKIGEKGRIKRIINITVQKLPLPLFYSLSDFKSGDQSEGKPHEFDTSLRSATETEFKYFVTQIIEKTICQFQSEDFEKLNSKDKILYNLDSDCN